jgi:hypothetical protein
MKLVEDDDNGVFQKTARAQKRRNEEKSNRRQAIIETQVYENQAIYEMNFDFNLIVHCLDALYLRTAPPLRSLLLM